MCNMDEQWTSSKIILKVVKMSLKKTFFLDVTKAAEKYQEIYFILFKYSL